MLEEQVSGVETVRRVLEVDVTGDGEEGRDQDPVGHWNRRLRRRERRTRQHTGCLQGERYSDTLRLIKRIFACATFVSYLVNKMRSSCTGWPIVMP